MKKINKQSKKYRKNGRRLGVKKKGDQRMTTKKEGLINKMAEVIKKKKKSADIFFVSSLIFTYAEKKNHIQGKLFKIKEYPLYEI